MQRRKFSREFKLEAVKLVRDRGVTMAQAAMKHQRKPKKALKVTVTVSGVINPSAADTMGNLHRSM